MEKQFFQRKTLIPIPADELFQWHMRPLAFKRLIPPWDKVKLLLFSDISQNGAIVIFLAPLAPGVYKKWIAYHCDIIPGRQFRDIQIVGPFTHWSHSHIFEASGNSICYLNDSIEYVLPFGAIGRIFGKKIAEQKLAQMFKYRHEVTLKDIKMHSLYRGVTPMKILVSGSSGVIGSSLCSLLSTGGHEVTRLVRSKSGGENTIQWDPQNGKVDLCSLEGFDCFINLCGENIASRWNKKRKQSIIESRTSTTKLLSDSICKLENPPKSFISASAIGYYGNRGDETLDENSTLGDLFLSDVCNQWEEATAPAKEKTRVACIRIGVVLTPAGGALAKMLLPFKMGGGGIVGNGKQYWSWIALDDAIGAIHHVAMNEEIDGPVNLVAPNPVTNYEFTKTLGKVLRRPTIVPMPGFAAKIALGQMADELLLASTKVLPKKLQETNYEFRYPDLEGALRHLLGK